MLKIRLLSRRTQIIAGAMLVIVTGAIIAFIALHHHAKQPPKKPGDKIFEDRVSLANNLQIPVTHAPNPEKGLVIYIADTSVTNAGYAKKFADLSYYVATVDASSLLKPAVNNCTNLAAELSDIATQLQEHYELDTDDLPILVGNDQGAALVYTALAQADKNTFHAGVSINFTSRLNASASLCTLNDFSAVATANSTQLNPVKHLPGSWYIFQDAAFAKTEKDFINQVNNARLTIAQASRPTSDISKAASNQTSLSEAMQILQWLDPRLHDQASSDTGDGDLPVIEVPVPDGQDNSGPLMAVLLTGDGGWAEIDKNIARILAEKGIPTVALDSLSYFWRARSPEETAADLETIINDYQEKWQKPRVILIGYSFGADVLPFVANQLSSDTQQKVSLVALLGLGKTAAFEFRLSSWMNSDKDESRLPLAPALKKLDWVKRVCIYGVQDEESNCPNFTDLGLTIISMSGDHHFDKKYDELVQHIIDNANHP